MNKPASPLKYSRNILPLLALLFLALLSCQTDRRGVQKPDESPEEAAKPWVFWYWMHGAVTQDAITADLEAMKEAGLGGAYLFSVRDITDPPLFEPSVRTMSPEWWGMVRHAMQEANRLGLKLGMNSCDGFTAAGGPWITPEMSMQKITWSDTLVRGPQQFSLKLPHPFMLENYYRDIATYAYPAPEGSGESSYNTVPKVTTSLTGKEVQFLAEKGNKKGFSTSQPCWIQYAFDRPFTCRSVTIGTGWNNYQSNRLIIEVSDDGVNFRRHCRLEPPRSGWQDLDADAAHLIDPVTASYFRFVFDPEGSEPGAEDIDDAKWKPALRLNGIELSGERKIHQYEGKSGAIWRISKRTENKQLPEDACVSPDKLINITASLQPDGNLVWDVPAGTWIIRRIGHTSTGHTNYIGGGGKGLECDKLNPEVVRLQFDKWFGEAFRQVGPELAGSVLKRFHVDSWECSSQNWSPVFSDEFRKRRGYDLLPFLPVMTGLPVQSAETSEKILADVRETIAELVTDIFYNVSAELAHQYHCGFSAESIAPVMVSDGMLHYRETDLPMGEFWFRSPSHDKPNDILDAISAAHIYGKNIVQAEGFTEIRLDWDEYPGIMKPVADRNFALGINKMFFHVFTLNPWKDRKPGMTLDKVGTFFQRDQTWWKPGKAFINYITNCQALLQQGIPVADIAVFTGEETPRRAVLPDRLVTILPGLFGEEKVKQDQKRLMNLGIPLRNLPAGVTTQSNMADPENWIDPLRGYAYDSFNRDALLNLATVKKGRIVLPGGAGYGLLVVPGTMKMSPDGGKSMSREVAEKLVDLARQGATILMMEQPAGEPGYSPDKEKELQLKAAVGKLFSGERETIQVPEGGEFVRWEKGKGIVIQGPFMATSLNELGIQRDVAITEGQKNAAGTVAWNHRKLPGKDIYFIANQENTKRELELSFRISDKIPELYHPVTGETEACTDWQVKKDRILVKYRFEPYESVFVLFSRQSPESGLKLSPALVVPFMVLSGDWSVQFDPEYGGPAEPVLFPELTDWSQHPDDRIRFYSGTAVYRKSFRFEKELSKEEALWLDPGFFANMAEVKLNGQSCGTCWTPPYRVRIDKAVRQGENLLEIAVTNTWTNRLIGDHNLSPEKQITFTTAPYRLEGRSLLPAGLFGPVSICKTGK